MGTAGPPICSPAVVLLLLASAFWILHHELRPCHYSDLTQALAEIPSAHSGDFLCKRPQILHFEIVADTTDQLGGRQQSSGGCQVNSPEVITGHNGSGPSPMNQARCSSPCKTPASGWTRRVWRGCSSRFIRPSLRGWAWDYRSAARSSGRTAGGCRPPRTKVPVRRFSLLWP